MTREDRPAADSIARFLDGSPFAVIGASADRSKYGNKVLRCYLQHGKTAHPIHPSAREVEGIPAFRSVADVPGEIHAASIITPPPVTERLIPELHGKGIEHVWMQPGAESAKAVAEAKRLGMNVIAGGPCLLVVLGYRE
jgi:predicted CoA-binding protein